MVLSDKDFELLSRFLKSLGIEDPSDFDMKIDSIVKSSFDKNYLTITLRKDTPWNYSLVEKFMVGLNSLTSYKAKVIFIYDCPTYGKELKDLIIDWYFNSTHKKENFELFIPLSGDDKTINIVFNSKQEENEFNQRYLKDLKDFLTSISYNFDISLKNNEIKEELKDEEPIETNKEVKFEEEKSEVEKEIRSELADLSANYEKMINERKNKDLFKKGGYEPLKIIQIDSNSEAVDVNGRIFEITFRESRNGKTIAHIGLDDGDTIYCTAISNEKSLKKEDLLNLKANQNVRIKGRISTDKYSNDLIIMVHYFYPLPDTPLRDDNAIEKRVELHLHTKMSDFDGATFFEDYVKLAKHMGHKAIALTDHGNVQAFPNAQEVAKKQGMKVIYGSELYVIKDKFDVTINPIDIPLNSASFVCFDTETTGLNSRFNKMMEFGAVKIINGMVTDRIDILINPEVPIPENIQKITNITDEMVKDKPTIKEVLPEILKFIGDSILVAHNLEFDYGYLNEAMKENGYGELKSPAIDTLKLAWYLFQDKRRFNLGSLCKYYDIPYETHDGDEDNVEDFIEESIDKHAAHRADYDAKVLSEVWLNMRGTLTKNNTSINLLDLTKLEMSQEFIRNYRDSCHITALVKNDKGVKELYELISDSHINHMGYNPYTTESFLESHRADLLIGSACLNGEVFKCAMKSDYNNNLRNAIKKFDFIEIQPPENYRYLVEIEEIPSMDDVKTIIKDIIRIAKEENKLICVTGDVHYLNPSDKVYRDVIISASQIGGKFHPLFSGKRANKKSRVFANPDQHYRTTEEMFEAFDFLNKDEAKEYIVTNTSKISDMCESIVPVKTDTYTPTIEGCDEKLKDLVYKNAHKLYGDPLPKLIEDRIDSELKGILNNGYGVIYWIAHLLVKKANDDGYIVGSRGSVGSSIVATLSEITEVNPLPPHYRCPKCKHVEFYDDANMSGYDLPIKKCPECGETMISDGQSIPFETFLGFDADKTPDIDLNFPTDYQSTAHEYTKVFLGANNVYRAGTISTVQYKTAFGLVRKYYEDYLHYTKEEIDTKVKNSKIASIAYGCVEIKRTTGQHPAGIVVVPNGYDINDFTPIQYPADDVTAAWKTTHFDFTSMHDTLLKLDILGHVDPQALKMLTDLTGVDIKSIPLAEPKVLSLFTTDDALNLRHQYLSPDNGALGLPEFGTNFVRKVLRDAMPKTFQDLVIISGLTHGTNVWNGNAEDLIKNKVANLKGVIGCRDDIMVYLISKGIEKHNAFVIMETVRKKGKHLSPAQIQDMLAHNIPQYYIDSCEKIEYLFPKGHATAYVMMALRVAYFKVYYPLEYYACFFTLRCDAYDISSMCNGIDRCYNKLQELNEKRESKIDFKEKDSALIDTLDVVLEMYERGYKIEPISIEKSDATKFIVDKENNALIPPFKVLDGMGETNCLEIIKARNERPFSSRDDLMKRAGIADKVMKELDRMHCLDKLNDTDQISLFDFNF